jgi:anti-sigma B factor antagonist
MAASARIALEDEDGVPVVRFFDRQLMDDRVVREVGDQITAALPKSGPIGLILDFANVTMISSAMIGRLVLLQRRADASGGCLRLCEMGPAVRGALRTTNLDRVLTITRDRREAREAFPPAT